MVVCSMAQPRTLTWRRTEEEGAEAEMVTFTEEQAQWSRNFTADSPIPWVMMEAGIRSVVIQREDNTLESWTWTIDNQS